MTEEQTPDSEAAAEVEAVAYDGLTIEELKAEIDARNDTRDAESQIVVGGRGNKPDLIAALEADDHAQALPDAAHVAATAGTSDDPAGNYDPAADPAAGAVNPYSDLVRVRVNGVETNMGRYLAEASEGVEILDEEPTRTDDGRLRDDTREGGRDIKPQTTVADAAAAKQAAQAAAETEEQNQ